MALSGIRERSHITATPENREREPLFYTAGELASLLRTTSKAIYAMTERGQLPGVTRIGRRLLFRRDDLLHWLDQRRAPSPKE